MAETVLWQPIKKDDLVFFQEHYNKYGNYSDFNPLCIYAYMGEKGKWAFVHDTLLLDAEDRLYDGQYVSLLGGKGSYEALIHLLKAHSTHRGKDQTRLIIHHVPEPCALELRGKPGIAHVTRDSNNDDYIFSVERLIHLNTPALSSKRKLIRRLQRDHPHLRAEIINHKDSGTRSEILQVFDIWSSYSGDPGTFSERSALTRMLDLETDKVVVVGVRDDEKLIAFTINEPENNHYFQGHFGKALRHHPGIGVFIEHETSKIMHDRYGSLYLNIQQDHGIIGLRHYKKSWDPIFMLPKYLVIVDVAEYMNNRKSTDL